MQIRKLKEDLTDNRQNDARIKKTRQGRDRPRRTSHCRHATEGAEGASVSWHSGKARLN